MSNAQPHVVEAAPPAASHAPSAPGIAVSVLMPAYNEAPNLVEIVPRTLRVLAAIDPAYEILVVDDGSHDGTAALMTELGKHHPELRLLRLRRNFGKSTALQAGFDHARGEVIVLMDADGQDQPEEIPKLLRALDDGVELATGRRALRHDRFVKRHTSRALQPRDRHGHRRPGRGLQQRPQGDEARGDEPARALRRAAPVHPGARAVGRVQDRRGRGRARVAAARRDEVRPRALLARVPRPADRQVHHHLHGPAVPPVRRRGGRVLADRRRAARLDVRRPAHGRRGRRAPRAAGGDPPDAGGHPAHEPRPDRGADRAPQARPRPGHRAPARRAVTGGRLRAAGYRRADGDVRDALLAAEEVVPLVLVGLERQEALDRARPLDEDVRIRRVAMERPQQHDADEHGGERGPEQDP